VVDQYLFKTLTLVGVVSCVIVCNLPDIDQKLPLFKHRGFTHSLIAWFIITFIFYTTNITDLTYGVGVGYASHLIADMSTPMGIELLWPFKYHLKIPLLSKYKWLTGILWVGLFGFLIYKSIR
jgi:inner membrane protein